MKSYNGNGLLPVPFNYSTNFGHDTSPACGWYLRAQKSGFALVSKKPFCGTDFPGTSTANASSSRAVTRRDLPLDPLDSLVLNR